MIYQDFIKQIILKDTLVVTLGKNEKEITNQPEEEMIGPEWPQTGEEKKHLCCKPKVMQ